MVNNVDSYLTFVSVKYQLELVYMIQMTYKNGIWWLYEKKIPEPS